jgi:hypothetical protein
MFKLIVSFITSLGLMFGGANTVISQPEQPIDNAQEWSVQSWTRSQQQERSADILPTEEPLQTPTREQTRDQTQDQLCDPTTDTACVPVQDQLRDQTQDRLYQDETTEPLHLYPQSGNSYGDGDGTCDSDGVPAAEPGQHGNGH